jgi:hypothetical protein
MKQNIIVVLITAIVAITGTYAATNNQNDTVYLTSETSTPTNNTEETISREEIAEDADPTEVPDIEEDVDQTLSTKTDLGVNDKDIELIKSYYKKIGNRDELQEAYDMKLDPSVNYETFQVWYAGAQSITPSKFIRTSDNRYEFQVSFLDIENSSNQRYYVIMDVIGNKLKTISSTQITSKQIDEQTKYTDNLSAQIAWQNGSMSVEITKNGRTTQIEGTETATGVGVFQKFFNPRFVADGQYLMYDTGGWEYYGYTVYDVQRNKIVFSAAGRNGNFTSDNQFFYDCSESGLATGASQVLEVPSFRSLYSADMYIHECLYFNQGSGDFALISVDFETNEEFQVTKNIYEL